MASKRRLRRVAHSKTEIKACRGKIYHPDEATALWHLNDLLAAPHCVDGHLLRHYKCAFCSGWHVGHRVPSPDFNNMK